MDLAKVSSPSRSRQEGTHIYDNIMSREFPRIEVKPVIRNLDLISVHNLLLEDSISISQSVSPGRVVQRGKRVQETSSKTTEATVSKRSIVFLINDILNTETKVRETL
jgi:hypothetical protein